MVRTALWMTGAMVAGGAAGQDEAYDVFAEQPPIFADEAYDVFAEQPPIFAEPPVEQPAEEPQPAYDDTWVVESFDELSSRIESLEARVAELTSELQREREAVEVEPEPEAAPAPEEARKPEAPREPRADGVEAPETELTPPGGP